jgi:hypothetical protein
MIFVSPDGFFALEHFEQAPALDLAPGQISQERAPATRARNLVDFLHKIRWKDNVHFPG